MLDAALDAGDAVLPCFPHWECTVRPRLVRLPTEGGPSHALCAPL